MILDILDLEETYKQSLVRIVSSPVSVEEIRTKEFQDIIDSMLETVRAAGGIGLAANQVAIYKRLFVFVDGRVFINPEKIFSQGKVTSHKEGCLSVSSGRYDIKRSRIVKIKYLDRGGNEQVFKATKKLDSVAIQHEMDHLNAILISD